MSRRWSFPLVLATATLAFAATVQAQDAQKAQPKLTPEQQAEMDAYMKAGTPGQQHKALAAAAGTYSAKIRSWHEPGGPAQEESGKATRTMALDGRVLVEQFSGTMMGGKFDGHGMTGYDNVTGKYWSTWNDSMSTGVMLSTGTCDAKKSCTFHGSWNDPVKKGPVKSRMTTRWPDANTEVFEMYAPDKQGKEMKMLQITYTRQ